MKELKKVFEDINEVIDKNVNETIEKHNVETGKLLLKMELVQQLGSAIKSSCLEVLNEVENDVLNSIVFMSQSFYRNSMMCLRSAMELSLSFIYYHDRNYEFLLWKNNRMDMTWSKLFDSDNSIISQKYLNLFISGNLKIDELRETIRKHYHECSEYVHGKYEYMQSINEMKIEYAAEAVKEYFEQANGVIDILILLLFIRFGEECNLRTLADDKIGIWNPIIKRYGGEL
ncbi:MAG: hypothetical protein K2M46_03750 [Lachnospiraceae bacterium]|nr:hypothetical protein [Lachnospiraceae bacterium]